jgi:hypothetical protein
MQNIQEALEQCLLSYTPFPTLAIDSALHSRHLSNQNKWYESIPHGLASATQRSIYCHFWGAIFSSCLPRRIFFECLRSCIHSQFIFVEDIALMQPFEPSPAIPLGLLPRTVRWVIGQNPYIGAGGLDCCSLLGSRKFTGQMRQIESVTVRVSRRHSLSLIRMEEDIIYLKESFLKFAIPLSHLLLLVIPWFCHDAQPIERQLAKGIPRKTKKRRMPGRILSKKLAKPPRWRGY